MNAPYTAHGVNPTITGRLPPERQVLGRAEDVHLGRELLDLVDLEDEGERLLRLRGNLERVEKRRRR